MRCVYCHNPDTQALISAQAREYQIDEILELLEKQRPYFKQTGGLTVSGGEPTLQASALIKLFTAAKARGFHVALDTNGIVDTTVVHQLYDLTDLVILDVKHIDDRWHKKLTHTSNRAVLKNAQYREQSGKPMWLRYVLVPGWTDQPEHLRTWAQTFHHYRTVERVEILPYHTLGAHKYRAMGLANPLEGVIPPTASQVEQARTIFASFFPQVVIG